MSGSLNVIALVAFIALLATGVALATLGLQGRMVLDQPRCARCRQRIGAGEFERSGRCPECGSDLHAPSAIAYFRGRRRVGLATTGIAIACVAPLAPMTLAMVRAQGRGVVAPGTTTAALVGQLKSADWDVGLGIVFELDARRARGSLSSQDYDEIVEALIAWQGSLRDRTVTLPGTELLGAARAAKRLTDDQIRRFGATVFRTPDVSVPAKARANRPFTVEPRRHDGQGTFEREVKIYSISDGDRALSGPIEWPTTASLKLPAGKHVLKVDAETGFRIIGSSAGASLPEDPPLAVSRRTMEFPVEVVAEDAPPILPLVRAADDPRAARAIAENACVVRRVAIDRDSVDGTCIVRLDCTPGPGPEPMTLSWNVIARIGGREIPMGSMKITSVDGGWSSYGAGNFAAPCDCPPDDAPIEIVFRPDPVAAEGDPNVVRVWADEVVVRNPPTVRNAASKPRATQ
ncbi:MAG: hypothetical protein U0572_10425 [Phycisphaerales bacterium]